MAGIKLATQYDSLISAILQFERQPQFRLEDKRNELEVSKAVLKDFDSGLSALNTLLKTFTDPLATPFASRSVAGGDADAYTLSATDKAPAGGHTLDVHRLAAADTRLSKQFTRSGTSLRSFFDANGAQTFSLGVAAPTSDDATKRADISVTINPTGATDEEILKEIQSAIDSAMNAATSDETIKNTQRPSSSILNETGTTARLSLRSAQTGYDGRFTFTDSAGGLLALLELDTNAVRSGTGGGMVYNVGTGETTSDLTAHFTLDGVDMYRSSNKVTDAMSGLTVDLKKAGTGPSSFSIGANTGETKKKVEDFIAKYNTVMDFLNNKTKVDGETRTRASLAGDSAITGLRSRMRTSLAQRVDGQPEGYRSLQDLGISIDRDGKLKLSDAGKLTDAATNNPEAIASLFDADDGVATKLLGHVESYLGSDGLIKRRQDQMDRQMKSLDRNIADWETRMERRETSLRAEYARLQETLDRLQSQQAQFLSFLGY